MEWTKSVDSPNLIIPTFTDNLEQDYNLNLENPMGNCLKTGTSKW